MRKNENGKASIIFIIIMLVVIVGLVYYFGLYNPKDSNNTVQTNAVANDTNSNTSTDNKDGKEPSSIEFKKGKYLIEPDKEILGEEYSSSGYEDIDALFNNDGTFSFYIGWGMSVSGKYTIDSNIVTCNIDASSGEYSQEQETNGKVTFRIKDANTLVITEASETYTIKQIEFTDAGAVLTDDEKEMSLYPFVKGIEFKYTSEN